MLNQKIEDWGTVALVCPCQTEKMKSISNIKEANFMKMKSTARNVDFICNECGNTFDYDIKFRLVELLNEYFTDHQTYEGFIKYVTRKGHRIRLRYIKLLEQPNLNNIIVIEAANLTTHPEFKN